MNKEGPEKSHSDHMIHSLMGLANYSPTSRIIFQNNSDNNHTYKYLD